MDAKLGVNGKLWKTAYTVEHLNKGHLGTQAVVPYSEVVPYWEVCIKLCFYSIIDALE